MRVGIDAHLLPAGETYRSAGVATYVRQLLNRLPRVAPENEYVFYTPPGFTGVSVRASRLPTANPIARIAWEQAIGPFQARRDNLDVWHGTVNVTPALLGLAGRSPAASIVTVHDLAFAKYPERFTRARRLYLEAFVPGSLRRAARVIAVSHTTREDLIEHFYLPEDRVVVVPLGVDECFRPDIVTKRPLAEPYILYVGTIEPRKNLDVLVRAFAEIRRRGDPYRLALVGARGWLYNSLFQLVIELRLEDAVTVTGFVPDLVPWYTHADVFVYPSQYEGFGLPPLEAMACGAPVVVSTGGSLAEVVGDAAVTVPPGDVEALEKAITTVIDHPDVGARLRSAGIARASQFSWEETAKRTADVYRQGWADRQR